MVAVRADDGALRDDLVIPQGSTWNRSWDITDPNGNPAVLTGWSARSQIRPVPSSSILLFEWNSTGSPGVGVVTITGSTVTIDLSATDSDGWEFLTGFYDVYLTNTAGQPTRIVEGSVRVSPSVTH